MQGVCRLLIRTDSGSQAALRTQGLLTEENLLSTINLYISLMRSSLYNPFHVGNVS